MEKKPGDFGLGGAHLRLHSFYRIPVAHFVQDPRLHSARNRTLTLKRPCDLVFMNGTKVSAKTSWIKGVYIPLTGGRRARAEYHLSMRESGAHLFR